MLQQKKSDLGLYCLGQLSGSYCLNRGSCMSGLVIIKLVA